MLSALRTLGQHTAHGERRARRVALATAVVLCAGFLAVPFAVLTGLMTHDRLRRPATRSPTPPRRTGRSRPAGSRRRFGAKLVNPANRRKLTVIVVGTGLAGGSAAATLGELGYRVLSYCYQDSPRRAHSIAAQGGINAAKNYRNDGDSVYRLFYDTVKGGDFRAAGVQCVPAGRRCRWRSSTSASRRACRSPASTAACSTPARSAARRCPARSTPAGRPGSNCCSARTRRWSGRSRPAPSRCTPGTRCST